jgi:hypothetical protein
LAVEFFAAGARLVALALRALARVLAALVTVLFLAALFFAAGALLVALALALRALARVLAALVTVLFLAAGALLAALALRGPLARVLAALLFALALGCADFVVLPVISVSLLALFLFVLWVSMGNIHSMNAATQDYHCEIL